MDKAKAGFFGDFMQRVSTTGCLGIPFQNPETIPAKYCAWLVLWRLWILWRLIEALASEGSSPGLFIECFQKTQGLPEKKLKPILSQKLKVMESTFNFVQKNSGNFFLAKKAFFQNTIREKIDSLKKLKGQSQVTQLDSQNSLSKQAWSSLCSTII